MLQGALRQIFALAEAYPDLKANQNFQQLQTELSDLENKIAAARRFFNNAAAEYNATRESFPAVLFAAVDGLLAAGVLQPGRRRAQGRADRAAGEVLRSSRRSSPGSSHPHARQPVIGGSGYKARDDETCSRPTDCTDISRRTGCARCCCWRLRGAAACAAVLAAAALERISGRHVRGDRGRGRARSSGAPGRSPWSARSSGS